MTALGYLPKSKKGLEIAFGVHFLHDFTIKMFFSIIKFQFRTFFPTQCVIKLLIRLLMMS